MKLLVLGGGPGGLTVANRVKELCGDKADVTVIDKTDSFSFGLSWLHVAMGRKHQSEISRSRENLSKKGIEFVKAEVTKIDVGKKTVETSCGNYSFDSLVVALGARLAPEKTRGLQETGFFTPYELSKAQELRDALSSFSGGKIAVVICQPPFKCPPAPYETAMQMQDFLKSKNVSAEISVFTPETLPMPAAGPVVGKQIVSLLQERGINFFGEHKLSEVREKKLFFENGKQADFDLLVAVPAHVAPAVLQESGLVGESGWVEVDALSFATRFESVFAVGDNVFIKLHNGKPLPKAAVIAMGQAEVVAFNVASSFLGLPQKAWDGSGECFVETSLSESAAGVANFYAKPDPYFVIQPPSKQLGKIKEVWADYWLDRLC